MEPLGVRKERLEKAGWLLDGPAEGIIALGWEVVREGRFDWQVWRHHPGGVSEAVGKPHWFFHSASRHMMRLASER